MGKGARQAAGKKRPAVVTACSFAGQTQLRPDCDGVALLRRGASALCESCDARSSTARRDPPRPLRPAATAAAAATSDGWPLSRRLGVLRARVGDQERAAVMVGQAVEAARSNGATWQQVADALGVTRQSAHARYGP